VKVQIAGVSSLDEALAAERAGADALGFTLRLPGGPHDGLTEKRARSIIAALPPFVSAVVITYVDDAREAVELCRFTGADTLQLHGDFDSGGLPMLRAALPHLKIIRALNVTGEEAVAAAVQVERRVDALILDTYDPVTGRKGATGMVHDWTISGEIVARAGIPVILAGGLRPENVAEAIRVVQPWGVDVHTGVENEDGSRNLNKLRDFVAAAKSVELDDTPTEIPRRRGPKSWGRQRKPRE
jgi:phosphoribosylanthranilate isomerase